MSETMSEETREICPVCKAGSIGPGEEKCVACVKKAAALKAGTKNEVGAPGAGTSTGNISGFQLPLGAGPRRKKIKEALAESGDLNEAHLVVFFQGAPAEQHELFFEALDFLQYDAAADMVREQVVREAVRRKIDEVVRKKAGGGGYVLYAPNKGKKHPSKPVGQFPTKLAAKRAELARFPPKDPKKLQRLRKEIERLMKDPKKRAEAEMRARKTKGTDIGHHHRAGQSRGKRFEGVSRDLMERAILSEIVARGLKEGLFREDAPASQWDEFIGKVSDKVLRGDKRFQRIQKRMELATQGAMAKALRVIQKQLGSEAKVKAAEKPGTTKDGQTYVPFQISIEAAAVGPMYLYVERGRPAIEMSDEAKNSLTKVTPGAAKAIRAALATAADNLNEIGDVAAVTQDRDALLAATEKQADKFLAQASPLMISMLKQLLVKKYRGNVK